MDVIFNMGSSCFPLDPMGSAAERVGNRAACRSGHLTPGQSVLAAARMLAPKRRVRLKRSAAALSLCPGVKEESNAAR